MNLYWQCLRMPIFHTFKVQLDLNFDVDPGG
jgi:hypothetical protein